MHETSTIKNEKGERQYQPELIKDTTANYYENLYKNKSFEYHPFHTLIEDSMKSFSEDREYDNLEFNNVPTKNEIKEIIQKKQNGKSCPDIKNEMLKRPGDAMVNFLYPVTHRAESPFLKHMGTFFSSIFFKLLLCTITCRR